MMTVQAQLFIPLVDNNGKPTPPALIKTLVRRACAFFGGATWREGASGHWIGGERVYSEPIGVLEIDFQDLPARRETVRLLAREVKEELKQESVYLRFLKLEVELI